MLAAALATGGCSPRGGGAPEAPAVVAPGAQPTPGATLKAVRARGRLNCGVHKGPGFAEVSRARICVVAATTTESNLVEYFRARKINIARVVLETEDLARQTYEAGGCDALSDDVSNLASARTLLADPETSVILDETIAKDPLGPVVRQGDDQWSDVVRWSVATTILAEELGLTQGRIEEARRRPTSDEAARLLAGDVYGRMLSLRDDWAFQILRQVGNYGEIFDRNIGPGTPLGLPRGQNALWNATPPGLMISPPMR